MERPREFRRVVFSKQDVAEILSGQPVGAAEVSISQAPKIMVSIKKPDGTATHFQEREVVEALCEACRSFDIPVPMQAEKRLLIDRNREEAVILQMAIGFFL